MKKFEGSRKLLYLKLDRRGFDIKRNICVLPALLALLDGGLDKMSILGFVHGSTVVASEYSAAKASGQFE